MLAIGKDSFGHTLEFCKLGMRWGSILPSLSMGNSNLRRMKEQIFLMERRIFHPPLSPWVLFLTSLALN